MKPHLILVPPATGAGLNTCAADPRQGQGRLEEIAKGLRGHLLDSLKQACRCRFPFIASSSPQVGGVPSQAALFSLTPGLTLVAWTFGFHPVHGS